MVGVSGRGRNHEIAALLLPAALLLAARAAPAQLRPLEPTEWSVFDSTGHVALRLGLGWLDGQRASLAGTEGRLLEVGRLETVVRIDRIALVASGTLLRLFDDRAVFASPTGGAGSPTGERRADAGEYELATLLRLTSATAPALVLLRFGTRLPTTDNRVGLGRDQTDFFALLGARVRRGPLSLRFETGLGIHGTRDPAFEQSDVWLYAAALEYRRRAIAASATLLGQSDGRRDRVLRGNEDLRELRLALRAGRRRWLEAALVHGLTEFSPGTGVLLTSGLTR